MEQLSTIQKRHNLHQVYRADDPGAGGACHKYVVRQDKFCPHEEVVVAEIQFQHGPRGEEGSTNGVLDNDLLEIVRDRLKAFQQGEFATRENACALTHIEEALMWMNKRAEDRAERGVLGTNQK
ncbi:MAG: ABC transporter ATPase [Oscillospiraceae bacterium]|nr:ABC transporter ATPase [Oscillospiraceae bacterium]